MQGARPVSLLYIIKFQLVPHPGFTDGDSCRGDESVDGECQLLRSGATTPLQYQAVIDLASPAHCQGCGI